jgi:hypothetical protein
MRAVEAQGKSAHGDLALHEDLRLSTTLLAVRGSGDVLASARWGGKVGRRGHAAERVVRGLRVNVSTC